MAHDSDAVRARPPATTPGDTHPAGPQADPPSPLSRPARTDQPTPVLRAASAELAGRRREHLLTLYDLDETDVGTSGELTEIVDLARQVTGADASQLNVLGAERQFTLHESGNPHPHPSVPLSSSVCSAVLDDRGSERLVVIPDTTADPLLRDHPAVVGDPGIGFYAGVPLRSPQGWAIGMLCVWSSVARDLDELQSALLRQLGNAAIHILDVRRRDRAPITPATQSTTDATPAT